MMISSMNNYQSMQNLQMAMIRMASGKKINSAADDAAGLSVSEKLLEQSNGYSAANENAADAQNLSKVAEGGLSGIEDNLQRIRELAVKSSNGIYSDDDKAMIQQEVDQLKSSIKDQVNGTEFNSINLLGNNSNINVATNPSGTGISMKTTDSSLEALGIADFDVTKKFNLDTIDKAISKVTAARADFGAASNRFDRVMSSNDITNHNVVASMSRMTDTDYGQESIKYNTQNVLNQYSYMAMQSGMQQYALSTQV